MSIWLILENKIIIRQRFVEPTLRLRNRPTLATSIEITFKWTPL